MVLLGSCIGVLVNISLPSIILSIILTIILVTLTFSTAFTAIKMYRSETCTYNEMEDDRSEKTIAEVNLPEIILADLKSQEVSVRTSFDFDASFAKKHDRTQSSSTYGPTINIAIEKEERVNKIPANNTLIFIAPVELQDILQAE